MINYYLYGDWSKEKNITVNQNIDHYLVCDKESNQKKKVIGEFVSPFHAELFAQMLQALRTSYPKKKF